MKEFYVTALNRGGMVLRGREIRFTYDGNPTWWKRRKTAEKWLKVAKSIHPDSRIVER